jgi:hypothetical protein
LQVLLMERSCRRKKPAQSDDVSSIQMMTISREKLLSTVSRLQYMPLYCKIGNLIKNCGRVGLQYFPIRFSTYSSTSSSLIEYRSPFISSIKQTTPAPCPNHLHLGTWSMTITKKKEHNTDNYLSPLASLPYLIKLPFITRRYPENITHLQIKKPRGTEMAAPCLQSFRQLLFSP